MASTVVRKSGDTLFLGGTLTGTGIPATPWNGAIARINIKALERIVNPATGAVVLEAGALAVDNVAVTFNTTSLVWSYQGAGLYPGAYAYEIEVTYGDATIESFPNNEDELLQVVPEVG
jgi:hypothetical protein